MSNPGSGADQPNPFSREGADASDAMGADSNAGSRPASAASPGVEPTVEPTGTEWPGYPPATDPDANPSIRDNPRSQFSAPGFDPQQTPPYGSDPQAQPYGQVYGQPTPNPYEQPPAGPYGQPAADPYGGNPYAVNPYQPAYGGYGAYGMVATQHPQAVLAMVLGIVGLVLSGVCVGGLIGIAGIVLGRKARTEIDATPGRYTGRGMATAGFVTGIISCVFSALLVIGFTVSAIGGS